MINLKLPPLEAKTPDNAQLFDYIYAIVKQLNIELNSLNIENFDSVTRGMISTDETQK